MSIILFILSHNILPIFFLIGVGFVLSKLFPLDIHTLSKFNFYVFTPSFVLVNLYETPLDASMIRVLIFCLVYLGINALQAHGISRVRGFDKSRSSAFVNAILFMNTGNIGLSLITIVFSSGVFLIGGETPYLAEAMSALIVVLMFNNVVSNTIGFYNAGSASMGVISCIRKILSMPTIYCIPLAIYLQFSPFDPTVWFFWPSLIYIKNGLVAVALMTLGVQLSKTKLNFRDRDVYIAGVNRLIFGPVLAVILIWIFGFTGVTAQTLLIIFAVPTAVNTALIAVEFRNQEAFATQTVITTTVMGAVTLTMTIYLAQMLYAI